MRMCCGSRCGQYGLGSVSISWEVHRTSLALSTYKMQLSTPLAEGWPKEHGCPTTPASLDEQVSVSGQEGTKPQGVGLS